MGALFAMSYEIETRLQFVLTRYGEKILTPKEMGSREIAAFLTHLAVNAIRDPMLRVRGV